MEFVLTTDQRTELESRERSRRGRADAARRARVILLLAAGETYTSITAKTGCRSRTITLWKRRFETDGLAGLAARHRGSKPTDAGPAGSHSRGHGGRRRMARRTGRRARWDATSVCSTPWLPKRGASQA
jgi:hypothetical protein